MYSGSGMLVLQNQYIGMIISVVVSYFIGNISPAILLGRLHGVDIRNEGSGNAGTTNVLRVLGKKAAFMTLLTDVLKGTVAVVLFMPVLWSLPGLALQLFSFAPAHLSLLSFPCLSYLSSINGVVTMTRLDDPEDVRVNTVGHGRSRRRTDFSIFAYQ